MHYSGASERWDPTVSDVPRTHRATLALLLAMVGATCWSIMPAMGALAMLGHPDAANALLLTPLALGGFFGALAVATVWRAVSLVTVGVAGGLCGGLAMGALQFSRAGEPTFHPIELTIAALVAGAALGGALLGRRRKRAMPGLVGALITSSAYGVTAGALGMCDALGSDVHAFGLVIVLFAPVPFIVLAVYLCRDAEPGPMALWVAILTVSLFLLASLASLPLHKVPAMLGLSLVFAVIGGGGTAFVASAAHHLLPARSSLARAMLRR